MPMDTINSARMRTGDGLGTDYPIISQQLWTAMQNAISGTLSPEQALKDAALLDRFRLQRVGMCDRALGAGRLVSPAHSWR